VGNVENNPALKSGESAMQGKHSIGEKLMLLEMEVY